MDLAINNVQRLIYHKIHPTNQPTNQPTGVPTESRTESLNHRVGDSNSVDHDRGLELSYGKYSFLFIYSFRVCFLHIMLYQVILSSINMSNYVQFRTNTLEKGMNALIRPATCLLLSQRFLYEDYFGIK